MSEIRQLVFLRREGHPRTDKSGMTFLDWVDCCAISDKGSKEQKEALEELVKLAITIFHWELIEIFANESFPEIEILAKKKIKELVEAESIEYWKEKYLYSEYYSELEAYSLNELAKRISNYNEAWYVAWCIYRLFKQSEKEWRMNPNQYYSEVDKARTIALEKMFEYAKYKYHWKDIIRFADYSDFYYLDRPTPDFAPRAKQKLTKFKSK